MDPWLLNSMTMFGICLGTACTLMTVIWFVARAIHNAGIVDVAWAFGFILLAGICVWCSDGWWLRRLFIYLMTAAWSLRLGFYLTRRFCKLFPAEDGRYRELREQAGESADRVLLLVFLWQALIMALLMAPAIVASANRQAQPLSGEWVGILVWLIGLCGESIADHQLSTFASNPENTGKICTIGLWQYSRHPNYFFEWLIWLGLFIFASASPHGWMTVYAPLLMLHLLINVTGVKPSEAHSLKTRGEAYAQYQKCTSMFVPWFKRQTL